MTRALISIFALLALTTYASAHAWAEPIPESPPEPSHNYHLIGIANTFVPGSGQILLGNPVRGAFEASLEISTFALGYSLSRLSPFSLDGVPAELPRVRVRRRS